MSNKQVNKPVFLTIGFVTLVTGLVLIMSFWPHVVALFQGAVGVVLALAGLMILYTVKN